MGYGLESVNGDYGTRRSATVLISGLDNYNVATSSVNGSSTCRGDSGGPVLLDAGLGEFIVGVHRGANVGCLGTGMMATRVGAFLPWITETRERLLDTQAPTITDVAAVYDGTHAFLEVAATDATQVSTVTVLHEGRVLGFTQGAPFVVPLGRLNTGTYDLDVRVRDPNRNFATSRFTVEIEVTPTDAGVAPSGDAGEPDAGAGVFDAGNSPGDAAVDAGTPVAADSGAADANGLDSDSAIVGPTDADASGVDAGPGPTIAPDAQRSPVDASGSPGGEFDHKGLSSDSSCTAAASSDSLTMLWLFVVVAVAGRRRRRSFTARQFAWCVGAVVVTFSNLGTAETSSANCVSEGGQWVADATFAHCICPDGLDLSASGKCTAEPNTFRGIYVLGPVGVFHIAPDGYATLFRYHSQIGGLIGAIHVDESRRHLRLYAPIDGRIYQITPDGTVTVWLESNLLRQNRTPHAAVGADRSWYLTIDKTRIVRVQRDGTITDLMISNTMEYPNFYGLLAVAPDGSVYFPGTKSGSTWPIMRRRPDGSVEALPGVSMGSVAGGLWYRDHLLLFDRPSQSVTRVFPSGSRITVPTTGRFDGIGNAAILPSGDILVSSFGAGYKHFPPPGLLRLTRANNEFRLFSGYQDIGVFTDAIVVY